MRDLFYIELRGRCEEIRRQEQTEAIAEECEMLAKTVLYLVGLSRKARKCGLLTLENEVERETEQAELGQPAAHAIKRFFRPMVRLVVDGTDPRVIEKICMAEYFSAGFAGYEGLQYLFFYATAIEIQNGTHSIVMEEILTAMLPEPCKTVYQKLRTETRSQWDAEMEESSEKNICADGMLSQADINRLLAEKSSLCIPSVFV